MSRPELALVSTVSLGTDDIHRGCRWGVGSSATCRAGALRQQMEDWRRVYESQQWTQLTVEV